MSFGICPVPACVRPLPSEHSPVCCVHHFDVEHSAVADCIRFSMRAARLQDGFVKTELLKQVAIRKTLILAEIKRNSRRRA